MLQLKRTLISASVLVALTACGGGNKNTAPTVTDMSLAGGLVWVPVTGKVTAADLNGDALSIKSICENFKGVEFMVRDIELIKKKNVTFI